MQSDDNKKWLAQVKALVRDLSREGLEEFEFAQGGSRVYVRWEMAGKAKTREVRSIVQPEVKKDESFFCIKAPFAGIVYLTPSPREPHFVQVGDMVEVGQIVAMIEAMKHFNEIRTDYSGRIARIAVQSGQLVEEGQVLVEIEGVGS